MTVAGDPHTSPEPAYRLQLSPHADPHTRSRTTLLTLRTTKYFSNFRYGLDVKDRVEGRRIILKVLGLRAPHLDLPAAGPAEFRREYDNLAGEYTLVVEGPGGGASEAVVLVTNDNVTLRRPFSGSFLVADIPPEVP
jgi:hypothetical protein